MGSIIVEDDDPSADRSHGNVIHCGHAQLSSVREMDGEGDERRCMNQFANVSSHNLARSLAQPGTGGNGTVNIPQEAFIKVLKAQFLALSHGVPRQDRMAGLVMCV
jgi:hypothetical protein